jgi:DNA polymerase II small subunit
LQKLSKERASFIAIVNDKRETQNNNIMLELEDPSGQIRAIASKEDILERAQEVIFDEVIGLSGTMGDGIFFIDDIVWPDVPIHNETKKLSEEIYAVFLSDMHFGSKKFLTKDFDDFLEWINGNLGENEQKELASKVKYIFIAGDVVDGIGVYPNQASELSITDIYKQYEIAAEALSKIPKHIQVIIGPGNHDYLRLAQPQPKLDEEVAAPLFNLENVTMVGNPAYIKIHEHDNNGLTILMYHGVSLDAVIASDPLLKDGYKHPEKVMKTLLQRRHLSPQYETNLLHTDRDHLTITPLPDIFHAGHVHSNGALNYRGVTIINSGTWQDQTEFQKICGHEPTPSQLPILNLQTRELKIMNFHQKND